MAEPMKWYHRALVGLAIAAIPLFALTSAILTPEEPTVFVKCEHVRYGPLVHGVGKATIIDGVLYFENETIKGTYQLKDAACFIVQVPDEQPI